MELRPEDLIVETYPPQPTTGWRVGTASGVKITHKPTGLDAVCTGNRSQHKNKAEAFAYLEKQVERHYEVMKMGKPHVHAEYIKGWADGREIEYEAAPGHWFPKEDSSQWFEDVKYRFKPERVYPETTLKVEELEAVFREVREEGDFTPFNVRKGLLRVANAAVKAYIQNEEKKG